jgi:DNA-binding NarL/FixJ family response regulator
MNKTVVLVEDDAGLREQLAQILNSASDIRCIGTYASAEKALEQIPGLRPDVALMDIKLPGISGIECAARLKHMMPAVQILMVTVYEDSERIFRALKAGASGYLLKSSPPEKLLEAVRDVHAGGSPMSSHIARKVVRHFHAIGAVPEPKPLLSSRESQVLDLLSTGYIYKEIADKLEIGVETVRTHVKSICQKMHARNRVEAVARHHANPGMPA